MCAACACYPGNPATCDFCVLYEANRDEYGEADIDGWCVLKKEQVGFDDGCTDFHCRCAARNPARPTESDLP